MSGLLISLLILAAIVGGAAYIFLSRKKAVADALAVPPFSEWSISHPAGQTVTKMVKGADGLFYFDFPKAPGSNNYITTVSPALKAGQTVRMRFSIIGSGKVTPTEPNTGPARLHLLLWRKGDDLSGLQYTTEFYRLWSKDVEIPGAGDYELQATLNSSQWTGVWGKSAPDTGQYTTFGDVLANIALIGFSLGSSSAGHGCYVADGEARLTIKEYSIT